MCGSADALEVPHPQHETLFSAVTTFGFCTYTLHQANIEGTNAFVYIPIKRRLVNCPDRCFMSTIGWTYGSDCNRQLCIYW